MTSDDMRRLFLGPTLYRLDVILAGRLVPILYAVGLLAILVWAIDHLFLRFESNFVNGLWGIIEIVVFGGLMLIVLRIACEAVLVFFRAHEAATESVARTRISSSLLDEVKDAIHDLAEADETTVTITEPVHRPPSPTVPPAPPVPRPPADIVGSDLPTRGPTVRRTARRTPRPKGPPTPDNLG
jgi:hypothetical protein